MRLSLSVSVCVCVCLCKSLLPEVGFLGTACAALCPSLGQEGLTAGHDQKPLAVVLLATWLVLYVKVSRSRTEQRVEKDGQKNGRRAVQECRDKPQPRILMELLG